MRSIISRLDDVVRAHPDVRAIEFTPSEHVTYAQLDIRVRRIAAALRALRLPPGSAIGLMGRRHAGAYAGYLAILRAGHVVVPLAPENPVPFHCDILTRVGARAAVASRTGDPEFSTALKRADLPLVDWSRTHDDAAPDESDPASTPGDSIAYVMFTSGSTGHPKGVPIRHDGLCTYVDHMVDRYQLGVGARMSHTFSLTFDPSVYDLFGAVTTGATLVVPQRKELLMPATYVQRRAITHWYSVPSLIHYALRTNNLLPGSMPGLHWSKFVGEPLTFDLAEKWADAAPGTVIENVYGPTEVTVTCSQFRLPQDRSSWPSTRNGTVPIGTVHPQFEWCIVDNRTRVDSEGELCLRGIQRFDGYVARGQNAGRFFREEQHTFINVDERSAILPGDWYRTGDRVYVEDGNLVHLGRLDRQVKLDGYRVELAEVEYAVRRHPAIRETAALAMDQSVEGLTCFYTGATVDPRDIIQFLRPIVRPYMIPTTLHHLAELPKNRNGKTDYLALRQHALDSGHRDDRPGEASERAMDGAQRVG